jgi:hypothetical protein
MNLPAAETAGYLGQNPLKRNRGRDCGVLDPDGIKLSSELMKGIFIIFYILYEKMLQVMDIVVEDKYGKEMWIYACLGVYRQMP